MNHRSTSLRLAGEHCAHALDFYERGAPYERAHFSVGVAAHAILEEVGKEAVRRGRYLLLREVEETAERTASELIREGRDFEGEREPPLRSDLVWEGRDLALVYARECPMPPDGEYEVAAAVNRQFLPCPAGEGAYLMARIDHKATRVAGLDLELDDEDGAAGPVLQLDDYKSGWSADERELRQLQRKIQAVTGWANWGRDHDVLRLRVINIRMRRVYETVILPNTEDGERLMARWRRDIEREIEARDVQRGPDGERPATPGACCVGCPYLGQCEPAARHLERRGLSTEPRDLAEELAILEARRGQLLGILREEAGEQPIPVPGGSVGFYAKEQETPRAEAPGVLAGLWERRLQGRDAAGLLAALPGLLGSLGLGKAQYERGLSHLYRDGGEEGRDRQRRALAAMLTTKVQRSFGVLPDGEEGSDDGDQG